MARGHPAASWLLAVARTRTVSVAVAQLDMVVSAASLLTTLLVALALGRSAALKPASYYFPICHLSDPKLEDCITNSIEQLRPRLVKGVPELQLVPLDPLFVPKLEMKDGAGNFKFRQTLSDLNIYGLRNFEIRNLTINLDGLQLTIRCFTKTIDFDGDYDMEGKIMSISLQGQGKATLNFTDVFTTAHITQEVYKKKGVEYVRVKELTWDIEPGHATYHFTNLFNGDKTLGDATNRFLNENWREAFTVYRSLPEEAFGSLIKDLANRVYNKFPKDELYPQ